MPPLDTRFDADDLRTASLPALTRTLKDALALIDVRVLDHFIVAGPGKPTSLAGRGLL